MTTPDVPIDKPGRRVAVSFFSGVGSTLIGALIALIAVRVMTHHLGPSGYGLFVTALTFVTLSVILTDLGVSDVTGREIAQRPDEAPGILGHALGLRLFLSLLLVPLIILVGSLIYRHEPPQLRWCLVVIACSVPFQALRSVSSGYFIAKIRNEVTAAMLVLNQLAFLGGLLYSAHEHLGVVGCAAAYLFGTVVTGLVVLVLALREIRFRPRVDRESWLAILNLSLSIGLIQIVNLVYLKADTFLLSVLSTPHAVGLYGVAYVIIGFLVTGPILLMVSLMPLITRADADNLAPLVNRALTFLGTAGALVSCGAVVFAPSVVTLVAGPKFSGAVLPVRILGASCVFSYCSSALGFAAFARDKHHRMLYVSLAGLVLNVVSNIIVIPRFGIEGAAWATVGSEIATLVGVWMVFDRDLGITTRLPKLLARPIGVASFTCIAFLVFVPSSSSAHVSALLLVPAVSAAFVALLALVHGLPEEFRSSWDRLFR